jgi:hypothetical protein
MAITPKERAAFEQRLAPMNGAEIASILLAACDAGAITEAALRGLVARADTAYKQQRRAILDAQLADLQTERTALE